MKTVEERIYPNTLIIPDLHAPFIKDGFLDFCKDIYKRYSCSEVWFTGDIIDNHVSSYHESDPDGLGGGDELEEARRQIAEFHEAFPNAYVAIGNHDAIPNRKAFSSGISREWLKSINEVVKVPTWKFATEHFFRSPSGVIKLCHGIAKKATLRAKRDMVSIVQGHYHTESYISFLQGESERLFAMQLGGGFDRDSYAMRYARDNGNPHVNVGILINRETPIIEYMP